MVLFISVQSSNALVLTTRIDVFNVQIFNIPNEIYNVYDASFKNRIVLIHDNNYRFTEAQYFNKN